MSTSIPPIEPLEPRTLLAVSMVADLNTDRYYLNVGTGNGGIAAGDQLYFNLMHPAGGQLWTTDGTKKGTRKIRSLGPDVWSPSPMAAVGDALVFGTGRTPIADGRSTLWRTEGTRRSTKPIARIPGNIFGSFVLDEKLYFTQVRNNQSYSLWTTDGTKKGTRRLAAIPDAIDHTFVLRGKLLFGMYNDAANRTDFWTSDGTSKGTKSFGYSIHQRLFNPRIHRNRLLYTDPDETYLFSTNFSTTYSLGTTDQYAERFDGNGRFDYLERLGKDLYLVGRNADGDLTLWKTDATRKGTTLIEDLPGAGFRSSEDNPVRLGNALFFTAHIDGMIHDRLYRSDGTPEGTGEFIPGLTNVRYLERRGRRIFFYAIDSETKKQNYYRSDGTREGTVAIDAPVHRFRDSDVGVINGKIITGDPDDVGAIRAISLSTGKAETIYRTKLTYSSNPYHLKTGHDGALYFATRNTKYYGDETYEDFSTGYGLWRRASSDEKPVRLINLSGRVVHLEPADDVTFFTVWYTDDDENSAHDIAEGDSHLYRTDGTPEGTFRLTTAANALSSGFGPPLPLAARAGDTMYFYAGRKVTYYDDEEDIGELWKSDGTKAGTVKITDAKITRMTAAGDDLYFVDGNGDLWTSNGTAKGTRRVASYDDDLHFGTFIPTARGLFFTRETDDHSDQTPEDIDLYFTDGTANGTKLVHESLEDLVGYSSRRNDPFEVNDDGALFFIANTEESGPELWTSDGTPQGTRLVRDIRKGPEGSNPTSLIVHDGLAYFFANDGRNGPQLWRSNGKPNGTRIVKNFTLDDDAGFNPHLGLASLAGGIVHVSWKGGYEIWFGDEQSGFRSLGKLNASPVSPPAWAYHDGKLVFAAHHPVYHTELWQADV